MRGRAAVLLAVAALAFAGCSDDEDEPRGGQQEGAHAASTEQGTTPSGDPGTGETAPEPAPTELELDVPPGQELGATVAGASGCLGCHRLGESGNAGPGPDLSSVGGRLSREEIARALADPEPPMPSYESLKRDRPEEFDALVQFLAELR